MQVPVQVLARTLLLGEYPELQAVGRALHARHHTHFVACLASLTNRQHELTGSRGPATSRASQRPSNTRPGSRQGRRTRSSLV